MFRISRVSVIAITSVASLALLATTAVAYGAASSPSGGVAETTAVSTDGATNFADCKARKTDFVINDTTSLFTSSVEYVKVPGMTTTINQHSSGCVIIDVTAFAFAAEDELQFVSVELDGVLGSPVEVQFNGDDDEDGDFSWARTHSALFAFTGVSKGRHDVSLVHHGLSGGDVFLHRPAMTIQHR